MGTSTSFHCEIESAWEGASRHQSVDGLCHFCCDSPHPSRAVSAGAACGAGSISQWKLVGGSCCSWDLLLLWCIKRYFYLIFVRSNPGIHAAIIKVTMMQATPPLITENCGVVKLATRPDSN